MNDKIERWVILVVSTVWAVSFIVDLIPGLEYSPSPYIHLAMMAVVGAATGRYIVRRNGVK